MKLAYLKFDPRAQGNRNYSSELRRRDEVLLSMVIAGELSGRNHTTTGRPGITRRADHQLPPGERTTGQRQCQNSSLELRRRDEVWLLMVIAYERS